MAAAVQRGTAHATYAAPTSTVWKIAGTSFRLTPTARQRSVENESGEEDLEVFSNPGHTVSFTGTVKSGQTAKKPGDLVSLTYGTGHPLEGAVEYVVTAAPQSGYGEVITQDVEMKKNDAADYSP